MATNLEGTSSSNESSCPFCKHAGRSGAELATCFACGDRYCTGCSQCACERLTAYLDDLLKVEKKENRVPLLQRFIQEWAD
jgi:hypothetical protein